MQCPCQCISQREPFQQCFCLVCWMDGCCGVQTHPHHPHHSLSTSLLKTRHSHPTCTTLLGNLNFKTNYFRIYQVFVPFDLFSEEFSEWLPTYLISIQPFLYMQNKSIMKWQVTYSLVLKYRRYRNILNNCIEEPGILMT